MIDTIKILLDEHQFKILDVEKFSPSAKNFFEAPYFSFKQKCVQNCSKDEMKNGLYFPKLTIGKLAFYGKPLLCLWIEFSIPKMMYGNNFEEVSDTQFDEIIDILREKLLSRSVSVKREDLINAMVLSVHYSKNIKLENSSTRLIINTLEKINVPKRIDVSRTDYRNNGIAIRFHTNSYELTFYDKIADLRQSSLSEKRAIEKENILQQDLLNSKDFLKNEVLRIEVRLNKRKKIEKVIRESGIQTQDLTFKEIYNSNTSKKILIHFWDKYISPSLSSLCLLNEKNYVIKEKMIQAGIKPVKAFTLLGILSLLEDEGLKATKEVLKTHNYSRFKKDFELINIEDNYLYNQFKNIKNVIKSMKALDIQISNRSIIKKGEQNYG